LLAAVGETWPPPAQASRLTTMQVALLLIISLAHDGALGAPVGATESSVAQAGLPFPALGAPRTFDLFYPELPTFSSRAEISTAVPVIHLHESQQVEHLKEESADAYLDMFPQDLLDSNKKIRPIDVRIIEHDGFIDYEIEFVELSEEHDDEYDSDYVTEAWDDVVPASDRPDDVKVTTPKTDTTVPVSTSSEVTAVTFVDLLRRARRKHRKKVSRERKKSTTDGLQPEHENMETTESIFTAQFSEPNKERLLSPTTTSRATPTGKQQQAVQNENKAIQATMVKQRKRIMKPITPRRIGDAAPIKSLKLAPRFTKTGRSTTLKPAAVTRSMASSIMIQTGEDKEDTEDWKNLAGTPTNEIESSTRMPFYTESPRSAQDSLAQISDNSQQADDSSLSSQNISGSKGTANKNIPPTTENPDITTTLSLIEELKRQLITISYDLTGEQSTQEPTTESHTRDYTEYEYDDFQLSESRSVLNLHTASEQLVHSTMSPRQNDATTMIITKGEEDIMNAKDDIQLSPGEAAAFEATTQRQELQPERSPKRIASKGALAQIIEDSTTADGLKESQTLSPDEIIEGQYHEINPGQYHEVNPGQYHEINPGQYHETNPGQYHESNPGQYDEKQAGQGLGVDKITVNFDHGEKSRSYNVKANAGEFIIGEVGRIDIDSGQTLEGVRYTAVDGEVDQARISDILEQYFGARTN